MLNVTLSAMHTGEKIVISGLFIFFSFFVFVNTLFYVRTAMSPTIKSLSAGKKKHFWVLMAVGLLHFVKSAFKVIEYISGNNGYLLKHEVFLYLFDSFLMLAAKYS